MALLAIFIGRGWFMAQSVAAPEPDTVRIATWNLRQFSDRNLDRAARIASIIRDGRFDVVALQELRGGERGLELLVRELGAPWKASAISPPAANGERLGYVYREDRVSETAAPHPLFDPGSPFAREPYIGYFRAGEFDFIMVNLHLTYTDTDRRRREASQLGYHAQKLLAGAEKDVIFLGDFNEHWTSGNLHYIEEHGFRRIIFEGTNLSGRQTYDNILYHPAWTTEFTGIRGVIRFDETLYDNDDRRASLEVSDHRPVYADFSTTGPDDD